VFQKYALFPHLNVYENIAFGLKIKKMNKSLIKEKVEKALRQVNLVGYENRRIDQLSGGQQQRVAIARAIVNEPEILLLDEQEMQYELKTLQKELGITFVYVTHDQEEALTMSDTVVVMNNGVIQQKGTPVADFIGESNIVEGIMRQDGVVEIFGRVYECVDKGFAVNEKVDVVIRPEDIKLLEPSENKINGQVTSCIFKDGWL